MKKLLIALMALGSISSFASDVDLNYKIVLGIGISIESARKDAISDCNNQNGTALSHEDAQRYYSRYYQNNYGNEIEYSYHIICKIDQ